MKEFNVIWWDFNNKEPEPYNVIPYFIRCYKEEENKPKTFEEFKKFVEDESRYMYWSRCQYEILISDWPSKRYTVKWDIHQQIMMNINVITNLLIEEVNGIK